MPTLHTRPGHLPVDFTRIDDEIHVTITNLTEQLGITSRSPEDQDWTRTHLNTAIAARDTGSVLFTMTYQFDGQTCDCPCPTCPDQHTLSTDTRCASDEICHNCGPDIHGERWTDTRDYIDTTLHDLYQDWNDVVVDNGHRKYAQDCVSNLNDLLRDTHLNNIDTVSVAVARETITITATCDNGAHVTVTISPWVRINCYYCDLPYDYDRDDYPCSGTRDIDCAPCSTCNKRHPTTRSLCDHPDCGAVIDADLAHSGHCPICYDQQRLRLPTPLTHHDLTRLWDAANTYSRGMGRWHRTEPVLTSLTNAILDLRHAPDQDRTLAAHLLDTRSPDTDATTYLNLVDQLSTDPAHA